jgi:hypothetical protein
MSTSSRLESYSEQLAVAAAVTSAGMVDNDMAATVATMASTHPHALLKSWYEAKWTEDDRLAEDERQRMISRVPSERDVCFGLQNGQKHQGTEQWRACFYPYAYLDPSFFEKYIYFMERADSGYDRTYLIRRNVQGDRSEHQSELWYLATEEEIYDRSYQRFLSTRKVLAAREKKAKLVASGIQPKPRGRPPKMPRTDLMADRTASQDTVAAIPLSFDELKKQLHEAFANLQNCVAQRGVSPELLLSFNEAAMKEISDNLEFAKQQLVLQRGTPLISGDSEGQEQVVANFAREDEEEHVEQSWSLQNEAWVDDNTEGVEVAVNVTMEDGAGDEE